MPPDSISHRFKLILKKLADKKLTVAITGCIWEKLFLDLYNMLLSLIDKDDARTISFLVICFGKDETRFRQPTSKISWQIQ